MLEIFDLISGNTVYFIEDDVLNKFSNLFRLCNVINDSYITHDYFWFLFYLQFILFLFIVLLSIHFRLVLGVDSATLKEANGYNLSKSFDLTLYLSLIKMF